MNALTQILDVLGQFQTRLTAVERAAERERGIELSDWRFVAELWTYVSGSTMTGTGDRRYRYPVGVKLRLVQKRAYTNNPAPGAEVVLTMSDTSGYVVGNIVSVSSSAGAETTTITTVSAGVSITVAMLALDHTTTNPLVSVTKYFYVVGSGYAASTTTLTLAGGSNYALGTGTIEQVYVSSVLSPGGFPQWFGYVPQWGATTAPVLGTGTLTGRFTINGRLAIVCVELVAGSTTTFGTGGWTFTLPVAVGGAVVGQYIGAAALHDVSATRWYLGVGYPVSASAISVATNGMSSFVAAGSPFAWATGDWLRVEIAVEV